MGNVVSWNNMEEVPMPGYPGEVRVNTDVQFQKKALLLMLIYNKYGKIITIQFLGDANLKLTVPSKKINKTALYLPIKDKWVVASGGFSIRDTHHVVSSSQQYAYDFIKLDKTGNSHKGNRYNYKNYYTYGAPVFASADGKVVTVVDGIPDMKIGSTNQYFFGSGNAVIIDHGNNEYSFYAHLLKTSIKVKNGDRIQRGDLIAKAGNSSSNDVPHLHYSLMNGPDPNTAKGIPIVFENAIVRGKSKDDIYLKYGDVIVVDDVK